MQSQFYGCLCAIQIEVLANNIRNTLGFQLHEGPGWMAGAILVHQLMGKLMDEGFGAGCG